MKIVLSTAPRLKNTNAHSSEAISIGLLSIATVLAQNEFRIFFIDANVLNLGIGDTLDMIMLNSPDIICFSVYTREMNIISELVNRIKRKKEKVIIILGGIHPTYFPVETIKYNKNFDYVVVGEGEEVLVKLISLIQVGALNEISELEGVFSQSDSFNIKPYFINIINDLSTLPIPNRNLYSKNESYSILTSRGCNHRCKFCMQPFEETVRYRKRSDFRTNKRFCQKRLWFKFLLDSWHPS